MSSRSAPHATPAGTTFELDRFELVEGERYEVEGRWSGVRGRVFIRPELTLIDGDQSRRLLADLAQKPWQPADGDRWAAAFPCAGEMIEAVDAELTVAPDITVAVKRGAARRKRRTRAPKNAQPKPSSAPVQKPRSAPVQKPSSAPVQKRRVAEVEASPPPVSKRRGLGVQLAEAQDELEQARREQARLSQRLDAAMRRVEEARGERDHATTARDQLAAELDEAQRALEGARADRAQAIREAAVDREVLERSRDQALAELNQNRTELEQAHAALQAIAAERDSAIRAGVEVERELRAAKAERAQLVEARARVVAAQQPVLPPPLPPPAPPATGFSWADAGERRLFGPQLRNRVLALLALAAAVVVVIVLLSSTGL